MHETEQEAAEKWWKQVCNQVTEEMKVHTRRFIVPLSTENKHKVRHVGTGSLVCWNGASVLLTCEHVAAEGALNLSFHGSDGVFALGQPFAQEQSLDIACFRVSDTLSNACKHDATIVPEERFAARHHLACKEELFFFHGFAGENSQFGFDTLISNASAYVTQQSADAVVDDRIFELLWDPQKTTFTESASEMVRKSMRFTDPGGFSGSLVWNTRYLEVTQSGKQWTPECAVVSGLLRRWDTQTKTLLVLRVEHVRHWLEGTSPP